MSAISKKYLVELTYQVVGAAIEVHKGMGRGLLESVYLQCMKEKLKHRKMNFHTELRIPIRTKNFC
jgi:GxxExxY protein